MRILQLISSVDPRQGGTFEALASLSAAWSRDGHECQVACLDSPDAAWIESAPFQIFAIGKRTSWYGFGAGYGYCSSWCRWLADHAANYDAIVIHGLWNYASFGSWRALRSSSTPYFVFSHGMLDPYFSRARPGKGLLKSAFWRLFEHRVLRDAAGVLFTSREERDLATRSFHPYVAKPFVVGFGATDQTGDPVVQRRALLEVLPQFESRAFLLFLGRIHPKKGTDLLVRAFAEAAPRRPDLDLVIAGPDPVGLGTELRRLATSLGVEPRIYWPGMLVGDAKWGALRSAEFLVLPSHQENFGIAIAEALMVGTPALTTDKVNIWRDVQEDRAGEIVSDDLSGITGGLARMIRLSKEERAEMSLNARRSFLRRYDIDAVAARLIEIFRSQSSRGRVGVHAASREDMAGTVR